MLNPINKRKLSNDKKIMTEDDIPRIYHDFMCAYGYVSKEQFDDIDIPLVLQLHKHIQHDKEQEYKYRKSVLRGLGYKIK